jgi:leucyl aminopeptidase (aminopeptidase T)
MQQVPPPQPQQQDFMGMMQEAAVRGDQKAMEIMVYFKKKEQESAVEAEMGSEVAALRKQLENYWRSWKVCRRKLHSWSHQKSRRHTGQSTSHE